MSTPSGLWISCDAALWKLSGKLQGDIRTTQSDSRLQSFRKIPLRIFNKKQPAEDFVRTSSISPLCNRNGLVLLSQFQYQETIVEYYFKKQRRHSGQACLQNPLSYQAAEVLFSYGVMKPLDKYSLKVPFVGQIRNRN